MTSLFYPLEIVDPETFGSLDDEQIRLICNYNALDLVLIENAGELFRMVFQEPGVFEKILEAITQNKKGVTYMHSETFPFYPKPTLKKQYFKTDKTAKSNNKSRYIQFVNNYKKT